MYKNLIMYRNELKNKIIPRYKIIGITVELILSKELFKKNSDLDFFLNDIFSVQYKEYVMKSRTMIVSRICRLIETSTEDQYLLIRKNILEFILFAIEEYKKNDNSIGEENLFSGWLK